MARKKRRTRGLHSEERIIATAKDLHQLFGHLPKADQDRALKRHFDRMVKSHPDHGTKLILREFAQLVEARFRAQRTFRAVWGREDSP